MHLASLTSQRALLKTHMSSRGSRRSSAVSFAVQHAAPAPAQSKSSWGSSNRFEARSGWTREKSRDEARFLALIENAENRLEAEDATEEERSGEPKKPIAMPDGRSRFVPSRPEGDLDYMRSPPGTVYPAKSTAEGPGLQAAILKVPGVFHVQPRDSEGNPVIASLADVFRIHIVGLETPQHSVVELDDGRLEVRWLPCQSGDFKVIVTINGTHIMHSPFHPGAASGKITASTSRVLDMPELAGVGHHATFCIEARDQMGSKANYPPLATLKYTFGVGVVGPLIPDGQGGYLEPERVQQPTAQVLEPPPAATARRNSTARSKKAAAKAPPPYVSPCASVKLEKFTKGLQQASLVCTTVGMYRVSVQGEDGTLVGGESHLLEVTPTHVAAKLCALSGDGLTSAHAGKGGEFLIEAADRHGNACEVAPEWANRPDFGFQVLLRWVSNEKGSIHDAAIGKVNRRLLQTEKTVVMGSVTVLDTGRFRCDYSTTRAGEYELSVAYAGVPCPNSPYRLSVEVGKTHPRACIRMDTADESAPLKPAAAGVVSSLTLLARDFFGNVRYEGGDNIRAGLRGPERALSTIKDIGNGLYEVFYEPKTNGEYMLEVSLRAEPILGSPFALRVVPSVTDGSKCIASGNHLTLGDCGEDHSVMVEARDGHGNPRGMGGDFVNAYIVGPGGSKNQYQCHVRDCEDGWYEVSYKIEVIGRYKLHIEVNGAPVADSEFALTITGGRTHPPACIRRGAIPTDRNLPVGTAGVPYSFVVEARDDFDEPRGFGGDPFVCTISGTGRSRGTTQGHVEDRGDGSYEMIFTPEVRSSSPTLPRLHSLAYTPSPQLPHLFCSLASSAQRLLSNPPLTLSHIPLPPPSRLSARRRLPRRRHAQRRAHRRLALRPRGQAFVRRRGIDCRLGHWPPRGSGRGQGALRCADVGCPRQRL